MLLSLVATALTALDPLALKWILDELGGSGRTRVIAALTAGLLALLATRELITAKLDVAIWDVRIAIQYALTRATADHLHALPLSYHRSESVGGIITKMDRGISGFVSAFSETLFTVVPAVAYVAISVSIMLQLDARLALVALPFAPLGALVGVRAADEQSTRERSLMDRWTRIFSRFNEVLAGIAVVKSFAMEEVEKRRFLSGVEEANNLVLRGVRTDARVTAAKNMSTVMGRVATLAVGAFLITRGEITVGTLIAFLGYVGGLLGPAQGLTSAYQSLRKGAVALETIFSILDVDDPLSDAPDAIEPSTLRGEIEFCDVSFAYAERKPVFSGLNVHILAGETVALVGPSGGGKTTFTSLLQRLCDPDAGSVILDGIDIRRLRQRSVRSQMGVVLQENLLFNDTIRANIAFGLPSASFESIRAAAELASAHGFIEALPEGYETYVGDSGNRLSAGQRQRIAIARALLKNPAILVLDEATSALDAESEAQVSEALSRLTRGRTTLVIAHRLSTVTAADRILVFRDGAIVESGKHDELVRLNGYYASLVARQLNGLLCEAA